MPYSFTEIEQDKTKTIRFVFSFLILVYFLVIWLIALLTLNFFNYQEHPSTYTFQFGVLKFSHTLVIFGSALIIGYAHWSYTTANLINKILGVLKAEKLDPRDHYHQMFKNIVDEVSVATGGRKIETVIIPTMALNAFALSDFSGRAVVGLTEGMLARLTRAQIEAVVGHEAAHIVRGDCLATTVTTSLFELFSGMLRGFELIFRGGVSGRRGNSSSVRGQGRGGGAVIFFLLLIYALLALTKFLSQLVRLFISRQREYRADAIAVRLTRDPLSLAEALYAIAYHWRGGGLPAEELESIFIVNPAYSAIDERESLWAEMFSTHPPIDARIGILLDMAHSDLELVVQAIERQAQRPRTAAPEVSAAAATKWMASKEGAWQGPFTLMELMTLGWVGSETWIQRVGGEVQMAYQDEAIRGAVSGNAAQESNGAGHCPKCRTPLNSVNYEGTEVYKCSLCEGTLVGESDIKRIIIRQDVGFSEKIRRIADGILKEDREGKWRVIDRDPKTLLTCPQCRHKQNKMMRMFYTEAYHVEVDKCFTCGLIWFDQDELEVLQYLIERSLEKSGA